MDFRVELTFWLSYGSSLYEEQEGWYYLHINLGANRGIFSGRAKNYKDSTQPPPDKDSRSQNVVPVFEIMTRQAMQQSVR